jgi:Thermopsin
LISRRGASKFAGINSIAAIILLSSLIAYTHVQVVSGATLPCGQSLACPTGLASYGYDNSTGTTYSVKSNISIGYFSFISLQANNSYTPRGWAINDPLLSNASTVQLNNMLVARNEGGSNYTYWTQNVLSVGNNSGEPTAILEDNVFNMSSLSAPHATPSISSVNGTVTQSSGFAYYGNYFEAPYFTIEKPFAADLIADEYAEPNIGVIICNYIYIVQNGTDFPDRLIQFDAIKVSDPLISNSYFYVNDSINPAGIPYDSEYVFGGPGNGESTTYSKMNATIGLFWSNTTLNSELPFESYYSYGSESGESAGNLLVTYLGGGMASVTIGASFYGPLHSTFTTVSTRPPTISTFTATSTNSSLSASSQESLLAQSSTFSSSSTIGTSESAARSSSSTITTSYSAAPVVTTPDFGSLNFLQTAAIGFAVVIGAVGAIGLARRHD